MAKFQIEGVDVIALAMTVVCGVLIFSGKDGAIQTILTTIVAYYFGNKMGRKK